jgi:predicted ATPase
MKIIHYIKLHNFKVFGEEKTIDLDQPSVLIGPNNSGKTSTLQAFALWSIGVKRWSEAKGNANTPKNRTASINRLEIIQVPIQEARSLWKNTEIRKGTINYIPLEISIGLFFNGEVHDCKMTFTHYTPEVIYCKPDDNFYQNKELIEYAAQINIEILYPMSGIAIEETLLPLGRINFLIGQGNTAEVLRNLCYKIALEDNVAWIKVVETMKRLFQIELQKPLFNATRGSIELKYKAQDVKNPLDISLAGRGQLQMLLLIAYLFAHKNSVLLLDEPDAHLEILRQKLVFSLLRDLALENGNQIIIATHSEVILEEAAETNLVMIIDGEPINVALKKDIKHALMNFGIEHYYKAKQKRNIIYVEGSTDLNILKEFALLSKHPAYSILNGSFNYYYTQNNEPIRSQAELEMSQGYYKPYKQHFFALKSVVPEFKGVAIFDSDASNNINEISEDLTTFFWPQYEIENYFIRPQTIIAFVENNIENSTGPLFAFKGIESFIQSLNDVVLKVIFQNNTQAFSDFQSLSDSLKETFWISITKNIKLSAFLEMVFQHHSKTTGNPILLNKGGFYQLVKYLKHDAVNQEIINALDLIVKFLS